MNHMRQADFEQQLAAVLATAEAISGSLGLQQQEAVPARRPRRASVPGPAIPLALDPSSAR